jgi:MYXO-CTERM domain-containing protein
MRRLLIPMVAVAASLSVGNIARAQEDAAQSPPTTVEVETSTVERTVTTLDTKTVDTDDDDDSDKTGLWGLLGLLGLAGLAGLKRRHDDTNTGYTRPVTGAAPKRPDGATGTGTGT